ncbi:MAG: helix-turn-helix domain-containing protein [Elusimicrobiota bacterium]|nr:helix-turn-helix domain-containing protein [Elusimicrobiota bacterium]
METVEKSKPVQATAWGPSTQPTPEVMDVKQLSQYLRMGRSKIYRLIKTKKIPASRIGRQYRFSKEVIDHWLKEKLITVENKQFPLLTKTEKGE